MTEAGIAFIGVSYIMLGVTAVNWYMDIPLDAAEAKSARAYNVAFLGVCAIMFCIGAGLTLWSLVLGI